jgi:hypothetical protein
MLALLDLEQVIVTHRNQIDRLVLELGGWTVVAVALWQALEPALAVVAAIAGALLWRRLNSLGQPRPESDLDRAAVLGTVAIVADGGAAECGAVQAGFVRLQALVPSWGQLPHGRTQLAEVLQLQPLAQKVLLRGSLADAARRLASDYTAHFASSCDHVRMLVRGAGIAAVASAAVLLLA